MKKYFNKITNGVIGISILTLLFGLILIIFPETSIKTLGLISSIFLMIYGIFLIVLDVKFERLLAPFDCVLNGLLSILLGIFLLLRPDDVSVIITAILGIWIISSSINNIKTALFFRKIKDFPTISLILLNILDIALGILVVLHPFDFVIIITGYIGIILCVHACFNIFDMIILKKSIRDKEKNIKDKINKILPIFED